MPSLLFLLKGIVLHKTKPFFPNPWEIYRHNQPFRELQFSVDGNIFNQVAQMIRRT